MSREPGFRNALLAGLATLLVSAVSAHAQTAATWPDRAVRLVVPYPPGGGTDTVTRVLAQKLSEAWKQPVLVDNRSGANGMAGTEVVAKAKPDGLTLGLVIAAHAINPSLYPQMPYKESELQPVSLLAEYPFLVAVSATSEIHTLADLIEAARKAPGTLMFASSGSGSGPHLGTELFLAQTGIAMLHVPYRGAAPAQTALLGGHVQMFFSNLLAAAPQLRGARIRVLAVTSAQRSPSLPDIPAVAESIPGFSVTGWYGLIAPAGVPAAIVDKVHEAAVAAVRDPEVVARLAGDGALPVGSTPQEFRVRLKRETAKWADVIDAAGVKPE